MLFPKLLKNEQINKGNFGQYPALRYVRHDPINLENLLNKIIEFSAFLGSRFGQQSSSPFDTREVAGQRYLRRHPRDYLPTAGFGVRRLIVKKPNSFDKSQDIKIFLE